MTEKILIVGGVAGGMSAATRLRRLQERQKLLFLKKDLMFHLQIVVCLIMWAEKLKNEKI